MRQVIESLTNQQLEDAIKIFERESQDNSLPIQVQIRAKQALKMAQEELAWRLHKITFPVTG
jgi:hypothetical protein